MSLPRRRILRARADFARVRAEGRAMPGRFLLLTAVPSPDSGGPSIFGFITPKYAGKAHDRNRLRRQLRTIVRLHSERLVDGKHVVILVRRRVSEADYAGLEAEFLKLARKAGLLRPATPDSGREGGGASC